MMKKPSYICYILFLIYMLNSGCTAVLVGAGAGGAGAVWVKGKLEENIPAPVSRVHRAVQAGLKDLKINITEDRGDNLAAEVNGVLADGKKLWIDIDTINSTTSKLTIRVGYLGDKTLSLSIRDAIKKHL